MSGTSAMPAALSGQPGSARAIAQSIGTAKAAWPAGEALSGTRPTPSRPMPAMRDHPRPPAMHATPATASDSEAIQPPGRKAISLTVCRTGS